MNQERLDALRSHYDTTDLTAELDNAELDTETVQSPMVGITVRLPADRLEQVRKIAAANGVKTTALIRSWIEKAVDGSTEVNVADQKGYGTKGLIGAPKIFLTTTSGRIQTSEHIFTAESQRLLNVFMKRPGSRPADGSLSA